MCQTTTKILHAAATLNHQQIAQRIEQYSKEKCSADRVQKWLAGNAGVPLSEIGALLHALDLRVIPDSEVSIDAEDLAALKRWAKRGIGE